MWHHYGWPLYSFSGNTCWRCRSCRWVELRRTTCGNLAIRDPDHIDHFPCSSTSAFPPAKRVWKRGRTETISPSKPLIFFRHPQTRPRRHGKGMKDDSLARYTAPKDSTKPNPRESSTKDEKGGRTRSRQWPLLSGTVSCFIRGSACS